MRQIYSPLDGFRSPFGRLMGSTAPFTPAVLFGASEPGVWYDPSDVANLAWRRNLLTFTEQFDNAVWGKLGTAPTVTANNTTDPLGGNTADRIAFAASGIANRVSQSLSTASGAVSITLSIWLRGSVGGEVLQVSDGWTNSSNFTLTTSWQRFTTTMTGNAGSTAFMLFAQTGTPTVFAWGAQLELGSVATDYQRISDVNTEVIERFPSATLYQDTAGTLPVTTPGQTVALALDKSKGLVLGSELVTNGTFDSGTTGWVAGFGLVNGTFTASGGVATLTQGSSDTSPRFVTTLTGLTVGNSYRLNFTSVGQSGSGDKYVVWTNSSNGTGGTTLNQGGALNWGGQSRTFLVTATATTMYVAVGLVSAATGASVSIDNISVKELPGFHATQATLASRPTYGIVPLGGRRNLLTRTEEFENAVWTKANSTVTANAAAAPDGSITADALVWASSINPQVNGAAVTVAAGTPLTLTAYAKAGTKSSLTLILFNDGSNFAVVSFNLTNGAAGTPSVTGSRFTSLSASTVDVGNGWYRCILSSSTNTLTSVATWLRADTAVGSGDNILIWGAQLETGSSATAYQRVTTGFDVTEAGVASLSYLSFDGVDDFLVTPTITPGIDKAQVFAGVRKLSDAATAILLESSAAIGGNNGAIALFAPGVSPSTDRFTFASKGTGSAFSVATSSTFAAPVTSVVTGLGDIASDISRVRANGVQQAENTADQGSGNFLAYPIYIGRRGGSTLPFNGQIYSLIVRFGTNLDAGTITSTETWVNGKTGAYA